MLQGVSISAFLWSTLDKFGGVLVSFLLNLVLARFFLSPYDYGLIGMVNVFISIANTTAIAGFGQAIIQSKEVTSEDYNTTFAFNLLAGCVLYLVLFFLAPVIASFYEEQMLVEIIRVLGLVLVINGFFIVQHSVLVRNMQFKRLSFISVVSLVISAVIAVILAASGWGVWTLVVNTLTASLLQTGLMYYYTDVKVKPLLSKKSFHKLFSFGGFMYLSTLLDVIQTNTINLILGKRFSSQFLGYYTQADKLQNVPSSTLVAVVNQVTFPMFSKMHDSMPLICEAFKTNLRIMAVMSASLMGLLAVLAPSLIVILLSDRWSPSIPIFQILCFVGVFFSLNSTSTNLIKALGKGKVFFFLQLFKSTGGIATLAVASIFGLDILLVILCVVNVLFYIANMIVINKLTHISLGEMLRVPIVQGAPGVIALVSSFVLLHQLDLSHWLYIVIASVVYLVMLVIILEFFRFREYLQLRGKLLAVLQTRVGHKK